MTSSYGDYIWQHVKVTAGTFTSAQAAANRKPRLPRCAYRSKGGLETLSWSFLNNTVVMPVSNSHCREINS